MTGEYYWEIRLGQVIQAWRFVLPSERGAQFKGFRLPAQLKNGHQPSSASQELSYFKFLWASNDIARTAVKEKDLKQSSEIMSHKTYASARRFQIRYVYPISLDCHQLCMRTAVAACTQRLFWLPERIILVGQENLIEVTQNLPDVRFLFLSFACTSAKTRIQRCLCNCQWNLAISYEWKSHDI